MGQDIADFNDQKAEVSKIGGLLTLALACRDIAILHNDNSGGVTPFYPQASHSINSPAVSKVRQNRKLYAKPRSCVPHVRSANGTGV